MIELLIVIAILVVLSVAVVVILNPAELLRQGRDSTRISDLSSVNRAIALYLTDVSSPTWNATTTCTNGTEIASSSGVTACVANPNTNVTGTGWVNLNFPAISAGSPLSRLPLDPVNDTASTACAGTAEGCYYAYKSQSSAGKYKLYANMESAKYDDYEANTKDGGNVSDWYEVGTDLLSF